MIKQLFLAYWQICLLKKGPENTPYSHVLMIFGAIVLAAVMITQWLFADLMFAGEELITVLTACSLILSFILYTYILLLVRGMGLRLVQTLTCLFNTHIIIHILAIPLVLLGPYLSHANLKNPLILFISVIYLFITLGISIWQFVITAHIYKYALSTSAMQSVLAAFGLIAINILTISIWR